jgi:hypothetical protein
MEFFGALTHRGDKMRNICRILGPIRNLESALNRETAAQPLAELTQHDGRAEPTCSSRWKKSGVRSNSECGVARFDAAGPARLSSSVSQAWWMGPPPIHSPQTCTGRCRMTRASRRSPSWGAACGFRVRAGPKREPAERDTGRLPSRSLQQSSCKGGLGIPATHAVTSSPHIEHLIQTLTRRLQSSTGLI